jgi:two-component system response regulator
MGERIEILLVEDTPSDIRLTQEALKDTSLNYNLSVVHDGVEAMEFLTAKDKTRPNLILLDLNMPRKNGHEVLADMAKKDDLTKIPVVLLTVSQDHDDVEKALHLKMNFYLNKPVTADKLEAVLKNVHSLHAGVDSLAGTSADDTHVRYITAGNPHTSAEILEKLAKDSSAKIRCRVAENPNTSDAVLAVLAKDKEADVRLSVAENPHAPAKVLETLVNDPDDDVRLGLAANSSVPVNILRTLTSDENLYVVDRANKTLSSLPA